MILDKINNPNDIKKLTIKEKKQLATERANKKERIKISVYRDVR